MLPTLSRLSVSYGPRDRLRLWCSSRYLRISPLHLEFRLSLPNSRPAVSKAVLQLSCRISPLTYKPAYAPFTPSKSGQRLPPTYYRGCWHVVSRGFLWKLSQAYTLLTHKHLILPDRGLQSREPSSLTRRRCVRLSPIAQNSLLLPPVGVWTVCQFQCGRSASQLGYPSEPW